MSNYLEASLDSIASISLHWSSDCNMACKYCYIEKDKKCMAAYNREIRAALEDGSFARLVKEVTIPCRDRIESLSLWGAEPTINSKYFKTFIWDLFDYYPKCKSLMFSTNALLGAELIYEDFFLPLLEYANDRKRHITFELQLSLDGPPEFNDDSRHAGASENTLKTCEMLLEKAPERSNYLSLKIFSKATLDMSYMRIMNERGLECFNWYYQFFNDIQEHYLELIHDRNYIDVRMHGVPTLVDPGYHTQEDGKTLAKWIHYLNFVDRTRLPMYKGQPLFTQPIAGLETYVQQCYGNSIAHEFNSFSCSASKNNITIDHKGNLYTCNRLCRNAALSEEIQKKHSMRSNTSLNTTDKVWMKKTWGSQSFHNDLMSRKFMFDQLAITMAQCGQINKKYAVDEQARLLLFYCLTGITCHIGVEEDYTQNPSILPTSYFRLLGNGAIDEMLLYWKTLIARKEIPAWNIAM